MIAIYSGHGQNNNEPKPFGLAPHTGKEHEKMGVYNDSPDISANASGGSLSDIGKTRRFRMGQ